jgi:hypothetical protein
MDIVHHIGINADTATRAELRRIGISIAEGLAVFDIVESAANWPEIAEWVSQRRPSDLVWTTFTPGEIAAAPWLDSTPTNTRGSRSPEMTNLDISTSPTTPATTAPRAGSVSVRRRHSR